MNEQTNTPVIVTDAPAAPGSGRQTRPAFRLPRRRPGRLLFLFLAVAALFAVIAFFQRWFIHDQLHRNVRTELQSWAEQVTKEIESGDGWDLKGYRRASIHVPAWYVVGKDGLLIDVEGFIPGLFGRISPPDESIFSAPATVKTAFGEKWRVFGRRVLGGYVVLAINEPASEAGADAVLADNAAKFGPTLESARSLRSREIDYEVEYAVVGTDGELQACWGGAPLKTDLSALPKPCGGMAAVAVADKLYLLCFSPMRNPRGEEAGLVIVPKEIRAQLTALKHLDVFNFIILGIAALAACSTVLWFAAHEFLGQTGCITLDQALKNGESRTVEFKSTFFWDVRQGKYVEERRLDILKSIAGFLNAGGGALFIGVTEDTDPPSVRGLDEDLKSLGGSKDRLQRSLRDLITARIGAQFSHLITDILEESAGRLYWKVAVRESPEPVFVRWKDQKKFFVREGPKTSDLDPETSWRYIRNKWG
jgi:hypothetical protein